MINLTINGLALTVSGQPITFDFIEKLGIGKQNISFSAAGITSFNTKKITLVDGATVLSYIPGLGINAISGFVKNKGYITNTKDVDLTAYVTNSL